MSRLHLKTLKIKCLCDVALRGMDKDSKIVGITLVKKKKNKNKNKRKKKN